MPDPIRPVVRRHLDDELQRIRALDAIEAPADGWLRGIRYALGMSTSDVARRAGVTGPAVTQAERSEREGTIRIETLRRFAEAMDCRLVYALVPDATLEDTVRERARALARAELARVDRTMSLEAQDVAISDERIEELARRLVDRAGLWRDPVP